MLKALAALTLFLAIFPGETFSLTDDGEVIPPVLQNRAAEGVVAKRADSSSPQAIPSIQVPSAEQQLVLMAQALDRQSYWGTMTYEFGGPLETLSFEKLDSKQGRLERIRHLSGRPREFLRQLPLDYCANAASRLFVGAGSGPLQQLSLHYDFQLIGQNRVADRPVNIVQIRPKDELRYGYTLGIDRESNLPLMLTLTGARGQVLERFQFVQLSLGPVSDMFDGTDMAPFSDVEGSQRLDFSTKSCTSPPSWQGWQPQWLPVGFVAASVDLQGGQTAMSFTDGLTSVSIFVSPADRVSGAIGVVQRGATAAAMTMVALQQQSYKVSVVGEIPPAVANRIASSVIFNERP
jgi:sigma-E factor negative regulatory protein RseB